MSVSTLELLTLSQLANFWQKLMFYNCSWTALYIFQGYSSSQVQHLRRKYMGIMGKENCGIFSTKLDGGDLIWLAFSACTVYCMYMYCIFGDWCTIPPYLIQCNPWPLRLVEEKLCCVAFFSDLRKHRKLGWPLPVRRSKYNHLLLKVLWMVNVSASHRQIQVVHMSEIFYNALHTKLLFFSKMFHVLMSLSS